MISREEGLISSSAHVRESSGSDPVQAGLCTPSSSRMRGSSIHSKHRNQKGQALVEFAISLPLLLMIVAGTAYVGLAMMTRQQLAIAARYAAREASLQSTQVDQGATWRYAAVSSKRTMEDAALSAVNNGLGVSKHPLQILTPDVPNQSQIIGLGDRLSFTRLDGRDNLYIFKVEGIRDGRQMGIGALFYGVTVRYELTVLQPLLEIVARMGSLFSGKPTGKLSPVAIEATCFMPAELPLRRGLQTLDQTPISVMELNRWLAQEVTVDVDQAYRDKSLW